MSYLLKEDGARLLQEDGFAILLDLLVAGAGGVVLALALGVTVSAPSVSTYGVPASAPSAQRVERFIEITTNINGAKFAEAIVRMRNRQGLG